MKKIVGYIVVLVIALTLLVMWQEHQENACAKVGGHSKYVGYGKARTMICLTSDGRLIEDY